VPAPEQPLVIGVAAIASPTPGQGQGGVGDGTGTGIGDGDGPGRGGTPPLIIRGASPREILSVVPQEARQARQAGRAAVNCVILADQRLDDCRIVSETPQGYRFGEAGLRAATFFRYRPPMTASGRPLDGQRVTINVQFGRQ
jgi:protein TonB